MAKDKVTNKINVQAKDNDGNDKEVLVIRPKSKELSEGQKIYNKFFRQALESGALLRQRLSGYMEEQGIWNEEKEKQYEELTARINENEKTLASGGIALVTAKELALQMRTDRVDFRSLIAERSSMDGNTAEGQSDNARFNYLLSVCLLDPKTNKPVFKDIDEYEANASEPYVVEAAGELASMMYNLSSDYEQTLPENKFLKRFKFVDEELRLVNDDGHLVDSEKRLINEEGRYVDYDGDEQYFVDRDGTRINEDGAYSSAEEAVFFDDDGKPVETDEAEETAEAEETEETEDTTEAETTQEEVAEDKPKRKPRPVKEEA